MNKVKLNHIAIQFEDQEESDIFFSEILNIPKVKEFDLSKELSKKIFDIVTNVKVCVYNNKKARFEVFITKEKQNFSFNHICIEVENRKELIEKCRKYDLDIRLVDKKEKTLLFIKDFSDNIYEIKS